MTVFLISDTHFDDPDILDKSPREFDDISKMNQLIVQNWNQTIGETDSVLFLGDLAHSGISENDYFQWVCEIDNIELILRGNHEPYNRSELDNIALPIRESYEFEYRGFSFHCRHKPQHIPKCFDGWGIHGHVHHKHPFIDVEEKRINMSVDVTGYEPVSIDELIGYIETGEKLEERPQKI